MKMRDNEGQKNLNEGQNEGHNGTCFKALFLPLWYMYDSDNEVREYGPEYHKDEEGARL